MTTLLREPHAPPAFHPAITAGELVATGRVAAIMVTWNRRDMPARMLRSLSRQTLDPSRMDVVVIDNGSTDGSAAFLASEFAAERILTNATERAHEPNFSAPTANALRNNLGFASLTIIANSHNLGGCGGFNTGFAYVADVLDAPTRAPGERPVWLWLIDDDADVPPTSGANLLQGMLAQPNVGLVGSRTVDISDGETTIETTIYFDRTTGRMSDEAPSGHPFEGEHRAWIAAIGGTKGRREFEGVRRVDVVSACSLIARWDAVQRVGFWDYRYFIYCDDADWCLRFAKAGYTVVCNLDAIVLHTPWHHKLTPARAYYAERNIMWVIQKLLPQEALRRAVARFMASILKHSLHAACHRRLFHADIIRRTALDAATGHWGKLDDEGPKPSPTVEAIDQAGLLAPGRRIAVMVSRNEFVASSEELRSKVRAYLAERQRDGDMPEWSWIIRNDVDPAGVSPDRSVVYSSRWRSKVRRQIDLCLRPPHGVIVFDQANDFPLLTGGRNVHIDRRWPDKAQIERDGLFAKAALLARWVGTAARCAWYAARLRPYVSPSRYG